MQSFFEIFYLKKTIILCPGGIHLMTCSSSLLGGRRRRYQNVEHAAIASLITSYPDEIRTSNTLIQRQMRRPLSYAAMDSLKKHKPALPSHLGDKTQGHCLNSRFSARVARFFVLQCTKMVKIYQLTTK
jgi:hypothetical protein